MNTRSLFYLLALTFLSACGTDQSPATAEAPAPATEPTATADAVPAEAPQEAASDGDEQQALEGVAESEGDDAKDASERIVLASADSAETAPARTDWKFSAGQHYTALTTAQGTSSAPDKIEVAEVFWYGCSHCFNFDPLINRWATDLPDDVSFVRLPVMWNPTNEIHARIFYTADALGKLDEMHDEIFKEIHINKKMLTSEADIEKFFARFNVPKEDFSAAFSRSPSVEKNVSRARNLTKRYRIQSVPILVVNGKYVTNGPGIRDFNDLLAVAEELTERERLDR